MHANIEEVFNSLPQRVKETLPQKDEWLILDTTTPQWTASKGEETVKVVEDNGETISLSEKFVKLAKSHSLTENNLTFYTYESFKAQIDNEEASGALSNNFAQYLSPLHVQPLPKISRQYWTRTREIEEFEEFLGLEKESKLVIGLYPRNNANRVLSAWFEWTTIVYPNYVSDPTNSIYCLEYLTKHPLFWNQGELSQYRKFTKGAEWSVENNPFNNWTSFGNSVQSGERGIDIEVSVNYNASIAHDTRLDVFGTDVNQTLIEMASNVETHYDSNGEPREEN